MTAGLIAAVAIWVVRIRDFRKAAGLFFVFCVLMAVAWIRLGLPCLGAVEVAIGALMTGFVVWHALGLLPGFPGSDTAIYRPVDGRSGDFVVSLAASIIFSGFLVAAAIVFFHDTPWCAYSWYAVSGIAAAGAGFFSLSRHRHLLRRVLAFNVLGSGIFLLIICFAGRGDMPMAVPFLMVTSGLVVAFAASLMVVVLLGRRPVRDEAHPSGKAGTHVR